MFTLHERLEADTFFVSNAPLCSVLLMNNQLFPWLILVPRVPNTCEIIDLNHHDQQRLMDEIATTSHIMKTFFKPDKLNVAALGNQVSQLHIHVIARFTHDAAWPNPAWGAKRELYAEPPALIEELAALFKI